MTKQAIIENILDMWLSCSELEMVKTEWKAFYNEPIKYANTIVIDMVKQSIEKNRKPFYFSNDVIETNPELMDRFFNENQLNEIYKDIVNHKEYKDFTEWFFDMLKCGLILHR